MKGQKFSLSDIFQFGNEFGQANAGKFATTILASLVVGFCFLVIYKIYFRKNEPIESSIGRSFPLMAPAVTTIFWLIQYSLPLSLGLLGALSFVRFRTPVKRAEDIAFILLLIAGSLACAVGQFYAAVGLVFLIAVFGGLRNRFPGAIGGDKIRFAVVTFNTTENFDMDGLIQKFKALNRSSELVSSSKYDDMTSAVFNVPKLKASTHKDVMAMLNQIDPKARVDIFYPVNQFGGL